MVELNLTVNDAGFLMGLCGIVSGLLVMYGIISAM